MFKNKFGLKLTILSISLLLMARMTISAALAEIGKAFPGVSQAALMNMVAIPSLVAIPFAILSGFLSTRISKKGLVLTGLAFFMVGGVGPMFLSGFNSILVCRALLGAGTGLFIPMAAGLFDDFFDGEERNSLVGVQSTFVGLGNIVTSLLAGVLATISWRFSFLMYALGAVVMLAVFLKLPEPPRVAAAKGEKATLNARLFFVLGASFLYAVIYFAFFGYLAFVIEGRHMGNAASAGAGIMFMTLGSMLSGLAFGLCLRGMKGFVLPVALLLNFLGFFTLSIAGSLPVVLGGAFVIGLGFSLTMAYACMKSMDAVGKAGSTMATGLFQTALSLGTAVSPFILQGLGKLFHNHDGQFMFRLCAFALLAAAVIALVLSFRGNRDVDGLELRPTAE
ncbi:MFS transporter [Holophaga foetida]|uniref:MFS transporter n=1 Tax=Holophaga foetida TaxID=35839 RepID=UPI0002471C7B|nr:MFS transporter [Holophaga foetida]